MPRNKKNHKLFCIEGIKNLMKRNYNLVPDLYDLTSYVDSHLSMPENWAIIKEKFMIL